jgi:L-lactate utilization protein LutC
MEALPGTPKEQFLQTVRQGLGRPASPPESPYARLDEGIAELEAQVQSAQSRISQNPDTLLGRFAEVAALRGWNVLRTTDPEEAIGYVGSLATSRGTTRVVRSEQEVFDRVPLDGPLRALGINISVATSGEDRPREAIREEIIAAGMGITGADYAIAETGSVIVVPRRGLSRLVSLVPPVHVALVTPQDVVETLDDLFLLRRLAYHQGNGDMGSYLNFITGPSRTADIEQTLVVGVHGPKEVHLVLLG